MWPWLGLSFRFTIGGFLVVAGIAKFLDPQAAVRAVQGYQILPGEYARMVGNLLPIIEVVIGASLVIGLFTRQMALFAAGLITLFMVAVVSVWVRGINIDCGCFGGGGAVAAGDTAYPQELARDAVLLAMALLLSWRGSEKWAVDQSRATVSNVEENMEEGKR